LIAHAIGETAGGGAGATGEEGESDSRSKSPGKKEGSVRRGVKVVGEEKARGKGDGQSMEDFMGGRGLM
jgi:hypothetical protein